LEKKLSFAIYFTVRLSRTAISRKMIVSIATSNRNIVSVEKINDVCSIPSVELTQTKVITLEIHSSLILSETRLGYWKKSRKIFRSIGIICTNIVWGMWAKLEVI